jgi:hypothetical protein
MQPFNQGDWIQWSTPDQVKRGQVVLASGPSIKVRWLGGEEQTFPLIEMYVPPRSFGDARMMLIQRPKEASRVERDTRRGVTSIAVAAASLGTTPKRVRAMLRSGQLKGVQRDGKWVSVDL